MITKYIIPFLALAGIVFAISYVIGANQPVPKAKPIAEPSEAPFKSYIAGAGLTEANTENIAIGTSIPGIAREIYVNVGSQVKAGDALFKIDDRELTSELAVRKKELEAAKAKANEAYVNLLDLKQQLKMREDIEDKRAISMDELNRKQFSVKSAEAKYRSAKNEAESAEARLKFTETNLERLVVKAPVDAEVLQINVRPGEFIPTGVLKDSPILLGNLNPMYVRVDIDENDAWRFNKKAKAAGFLRGNKDFKTNLNFVREEPFIVPKKSLTGDSTERVDTRVLQILYSFPRESLPIFVGQQMDIFIEAPGIVSKK